MTTTAQNLDPERAEVQAPGYVDLVAVSQELQVEHDPARDQLWVGKIGLTNRGEILLDGLARGIPSGELGAGVEAFKALLQSRGLPKKPSSNCPRRPSKARKAFDTPRRQPRHQRKEADKAVDRFLKFLADTRLRAERRSAGTFVITPGGVKFNVYSGRIKIRQQTTYPVRGLIALAHVLARETTHPKFGHLYPSTLGDLDLTLTQVSSALTNALERSWATSIAAQAMAYA